MQVGKADWAAVQQGPPWAVDAWGLGCLMHEAYAGQTLARIEDLRSIDAIPKAVLPVLSGYCYYSIYMSLLLPRESHGQVSPKHVKLSVFGWKAGM